jgi:hypothetical protein
MPGEPERNLDRRELLTKRVPACAMACLGLGSLPAVPMLGLKLEAQDQHKWDVPRDMSLSARQRMSMQYNQYFGLIRTLQSSMEEPALIQLLNRHSEAVGRRSGEQQAREFPDTEFATFVNQFRPPRYGTSLTHEVVEDTEKAFGLRVTECIWAATFREAGLGGEIGHAAVCNMDYYWPTAFNPDFKMERDKTLMQGHDCCNHRYVNTAE